MKKQSFKLQAFHTPVLWPAVEILGELSRGSEHLGIHYALQDPNGKVVIPTSKDPPARQNDLWTTTCFELFLGPIGTATYWEVNLSPIGFWNIYRFDTYRSGMQEEKAFTALPFEVERQGSELHLQLELDLGALGLAEEELEVAIATVLQSQNNQISYWALTHPGSEADFHRRDSFILTA